MMSSACDDCVPGSSPTRRASHRGAHVGRQVGGRLDDETHDGIEKARKHLFSLAAANFLGRAHVYPPVRHAFRRLAGSPVFALTALITLGVAIGANALIFSVVNGVLLKPLPFAAPDQLVGVWHFAPGIMAGDLNQAPATYLTYREAKVFQDIGMWRDEAASVTGHGEPERVDTLRLTQGTLDLLGVRPELGRVFTPEDDAHGSAPTVILAPRLLAPGLWRQPERATAVVGDRRHADASSRRPSGKLPLPQRATGGGAALPLNRAELFVGNFSYHALARLKPGGRSSRRVRTLPA